VSRDGAEAKADFLFFHVDLMILNSCSRPVSSLDWWRRAHLRLRRYGRDFNAFSNFDEGAELRGAQNLAMNDVADAMSGEEALPNIGLKLLDARERRRFCGSTPRTTALTFSPFLTTSDGCLTRLVQLRLET